MKVVFFGSSHLSTIILSALVNSDIEVPLVVTKAPKKKGRGKKESSTPVGKMAMDLSLNFVEEDNPNSQDVENKIKETGVNTFILASYGAILKENILNIAEYPLNIHPSLLPKYRGASPVTRALMNGDKKTGITIFLMSADVDTGSIVRMKEIPIRLLEVRTELEERLFNEAVEPAISVLKDIENGIEIHSLSQDDSKASYAPKIKKEECRINWKDTSSAIEGKIRGLSYTPGAFCIFKEQKLKLLRAVQMKNPKITGFPGEIIEAKNNLVVKCGEGVIEIIEVQLQDRKKMDAKSFTNGHHIKTGEILG
jgi:methionyl-tRNA formyltransferase